VIIEDIYFLSARHIFLKEDSSLIFKKSGKNQMEGNANYQKLKLLDR